MDSKHMDKIIRMASEIDRESEDGWSCAYKEMGNPNDCLLLMVAARLVRREPYCLISSNGNAVSSFCALAERTTNTINVSVKVSHDLGNKYLLVPEGAQDSGEMFTLNLDAQTITHGNPHPLEEDSERIDKIILLAKGTVARNADGGIFKFGEEQCRELAQKFSPAEALELGDLETLNKGEEALVRLSTIELVLLQAASFLLERKVCMICSTSVRKIDLFFHLADRITAAGVRVKPLGYPRKKDHWLFVPLGAPDKGELLFFELDQPGGDKFPCKVDHGTYNIPISSMTAREASNEAARGNDPGFDRSH